MSCTTTMVQAAHAAEMALAAMAMRSLFVRECEANPEVAELRFTVRHEDLPGLVTLEVEARTATGLPVGGFVL